MACTECPSVLVLLLFISLFLSSIAAVFSVKQSCICSVDNNECMCVCVLVCLFQMGVYSEIIEDYST